MAMHSMLINKPPDAGTLSSRHPLHQVRDTFINVNYSPAVIVLLILQMRLFNAHTGFILFSVSTS